MRPSNKTLAISALSIILTCLTVGRSSTVLTAGKWDRNEISVCFADPEQKKDSRMHEEAKTFPSKPKYVSITAKEREWIRSIIEQEYRKDRTIVSFTGWRDCDSKNPAAVWVYMGKGGPGGASITGQDMVLQHYLQVNKPEGPEIFAVKERIPGQKPSSVFLRRTDEENSAKLKINEETNLKLSALHEFGHVVGLVHENEREEANRDGNCFLGRQGRQIQRNLKIDYKTKYDPGSIMNYCFLFSLAENTGMKFDIAKASRNPEQMPDQGLPIITWPGVAGIDPGRIVNKVELADRFRVEVRPGLSPGDVHTLKCFYGPQDAESQKLCNENTPVFVF